MDSVSSSPRPLSPAPRQPAAEPSSGPLARAWHWLDKETLPQGDTKGDFDRPAYTQALMNGAIEGFALGGWRGSVISCVASSAGVYTEDKTGSHALGLATGMATGLGVGVLTGLAAGPPGVVMGAAEGVLLGGFSTFRGDQKSRVRDAASLGTLLASALHGPSKVASGIGAALATHIGENATVAKLAERIGLSPTATKLMLGAALGVGTGMALSLVGLAPLGAAATAAICAGTSAIGSVFGPRYSQFFRNLSKDFGNFAAGEATRLGLHAPGEDNPRVRNCLGALPTSMVKEGFKSFVLSDGHLLPTLVAAVLQAVRQIDIFTHCHIDGPKSSSLPANTSAPPSQAAANSAASLPDALVPAPQDTTAKLAGSTS